METEAKDIKIFKSIVNLVTSLEFQDSQSEFFTKHQDTFTDDEENKLEYQEIYESYLRIVDEADITEFYTGFKEKFKSYEGIHKVTVDTLFGFVDFLKFKESVLETKKAGSIKQNEGL